MKVTLNIVPDTQEESVEFYVHELTPAIKAHAFDLQSCGQCADDHRMATVQVAQGSVGGTEHKPAAASSQKNAHSACSEVPLQPDYFYGHKDGAIIVLREEHIVLVRMEHGSVVLYTTKGTCVSYKRLMDFESNAFSSLVRISKSALVNLNHIARIEPGFSGSLSVRLDNSMVEWISRRCVASFKKRLGM